MTNKPDPAPSIGQSTSSQRFLIAGCQRSGTTLVRLILECHSQVFCFDEQKAYVALKHNTVEEAMGARFVGFKIPIWTEQLDDDWLYDVGQGMWCKHFYHHEPILFLLRDVRDVVVSMMDLKILGFNWWATLGSLTLKMKLKSQVFRQRYDQEIKKIGDLDTNHLGAAALYWKYKTQAYFDYREKGWPVYGVRYDRLVTHQAEEIGNILEFLGLKWEDNVLAHFRLPHTELDQSGNAMGQTDPTRPIDSTSLGRWQKRFSSSEVDQIMSVAEDLNVRISQQPEPTERASESNRLSLGERNALSDKLETTLSWLAERDRAALVLAAQLASKDQEVQRLTAELAAHTDRN